SRAVAPPRRHLLAQAPRSGAAGSFDYPEVRMHSEDHVPLAARVARRLSGVAGRGPGAALALWGPPGIGTSFVARSVLGHLTSASASVRGGDGVGVWAEAFGPGHRLPAWARRAVERLRSGEAVPTADAAHAVLAAWAA